MDIFLSPLSAYWTEQEITLYLQLSKALDIYSTQCSQLDQIYGGYYSEKEKIYLLVPEPHGIHYVEDAGSIAAVTPQLGNAVSLQASSLSLVLQPSRKNIWWSTALAGTQRSGLELLKPHSSHSRAACRLLPNSIPFHRSKNVGLQPCRFTHHSACKMKLFCRFYLIFLLGKPFLFNWGLFHLPLVYDAGSALD